MAITASALDPRRANISAASRSRIRFTAALLGLISSFWLRYRRTCEAQELEAFFEVDNLRLVLVEGQAPGRQPVGQPLFDLFGLFPAVAHRYQESRRGESHPPPLAEPCGSLSAYTAPIVQPAGLRPNRQ